MVAQLRHGRRGDQGVEAGPGGGILLVRAHQLVSGASEASSGHEHALGPRLLVDGVERHSRVNGDLLPGRSVAGAVGDLDAGELPDLGQLTGSPVRALAQGGNLGAPQ